MKTSLGSRPEDLVAAVGPSIGPCCYEVGEEVRERFEHEGVQQSDLVRWFSHEAHHLAANPPMVNRAGQGSPGAMFLNLWDATRDQLERAGIERDQIFVAALCTASHDESFCSYRRDGSGAGRLAAVIRKRDSHSGSSS
jgi:hypothetical protein